MVWLVIPTTPQCDGDLSSIIYRVSNIVAVGQQACYEHSSFQLCTLCCVQSIVQHWSVPAIKNTVGITPLCLIMHKNNCARSMLKISTLCPISYHKLVFFVHM